MNGKEKNGTSIEGFTERHDKNFVIGTEYKDLIKEIELDAADGDSDIDFPALVCDVFVHALDTVCASVAKFSNQKLETDRHLYKHTPKNFKFTNHGVLDYSRFYIT